MGGGGGGTGGGGGQLELSVVHHAPAALWYQWRALRPVPLLLAGSGRQAANTSSVLTSRIGKLLLAGANTTHCALGSQECVLVLAMYDHA